MAIKTIVVPFDFSDCATHALEVAARIAHLTDASIYVVHLYEQTDSTAEAMRKRRELDERLGQVKDYPFLQGLHLRKFILRQLSLTEIFKNPRIAEVDLIVMGSHGAQGFRRGIVGSNTQRIVRLAPMPVLVIKQRIEDLVIQDVVFASNFTRDDLEKFDAFKPFFELFDPKIHLLKVNTPQKFERSDDTNRAIDRFLQRHELRKFTATIYNDLSIEEGILNFARDIDADLIAMATHGRTGFFHVVNGSLTEDIVNHTNYPVLSVKL
jgi:nucleotide-binding universal stress UspA family protein